MGYSFSSVLSSLGVDTMNPILFSCENKYQTENYIQDLDMGISQKEIKIHNYKYIYIYTHM